MKPSGAHVSPLGVDELARRRRIREVKAQQRRLQSIERALLDVARHDAYLKGVDFHYVYEGRWSA